MARAFASHQCNLGSNPGVNTICGLSLLLVLSVAPRGFSPVFPSPQKPTFPNSSSTRNQVHEEPLLKWMCYLHLKSLLIHIPLMQHVVCDFVYIYHCPDTKTLFCLCN